jgi:hypothetical protein
MMLTVVASLLRAGDGPRARLFVHESESWEEDGDQALGGGARPQTAEIIKTVHERCPDVIVTAEKDRADYALRLEHEGGKGILERDNKFVLFDAEGDAVGSGSTRRLGNAVKDACALARTDWRRRRQ